MRSVHEPVLLHEVVHNLSSISPRDYIPWYVDGTLGGAGHALAVAEAFGGKINILGFDRDPQAIQRVTNKLRGKSEKLLLENDDYRNLDVVLERHGIGSVDLVLLDLGISSDELDNSGKGFTFKKDEPLLMTMGDPAKYPFTAKNIVNDWEENVIADVLFGYAEEKFSRRIARHIINYREKKPIETSAELAEVVRSAVPPFYRRAKIHPATKTFQALRIAVNDELGALKDGLNKGYERLSSGGRMAVISFHSLEDRLVKDFYKNKSSTGALIITKKPIVATDEEIERNPRSRSAKLRVIQKN